jgi:hypothetical protein
VAIITSHPIAPCPEIPHLNVRSAKALIQPVTKDAQFIKRFDVVRSLHHTMLFCLIIVDLKNTMYKLATQKMMLPK